MEYVLDNAKWGYIAIILFLGGIFFLIADIKFRLFKIDPLKEFLGFTDNQMKLLSIGLIVLILWVVLPLYNEFISAKIDVDQMTLKYLKPRPPMVISNGLVDHYRIKTSEYEESKGNRRLTIFLKNGKRYKSTYVGPENREILNQLIAQLDILIKNE